jgi:Ca-activated chloride channel family protein
VRPLSFRTALLLALLLPAALQAVETLPEKYRTWLEDVELLLTTEERDAFLALTKDYQRDAFIRHFWEVRDDQPRTPRNELREGWEARVQEARKRYGGLADGRARVLLFNGVPDQVLLSECPMVLWPLEVWYYSRSERTKSELVVILYQKWRAGRYRIWNPHETAGVLLADGAATDGAPVDRSAGLQAEGGYSRAGVRACGDEEKGRKIAAAVGWVASQGFHWDVLEATLDSPPQPPSGEWVSTWRSYSTDVPESAPALSARLEVGFPGRQQSRTVLQGLLTVPVAEAGLVQLAGSRSYNFLLNGEVLLLNGAETELFDSFRYRFDLPAWQAAGSATLPLVFQRPLRPGDYTLVLKLEDVNSGRLFHVEQPLSVPVVDRVLPAPADRVTPVDTETARLLAESNAALANGETVVQILPPPGELQTGMNRFDTLTSIDVARVTFALDGKPVLTKRKPPFSVELDLGSLPRPRTLTATGFDAAGREVARDERTVNAAANRFRVRLLEPRRGQRYESSLLARAEVEVPDGESVERVELFLNETRVATLYQPPYSQPIVLPRDQPLAYVRAVAVLADGSSTEDLVFVNAPDVLGKMDIQFVELYTSVLDRQGRPVQGLSARDFKVAEDGVPQEIARFERVTDLPIHAAIALDVSASMEGSLEQARDAALEFLEQTVRPKDRAAVITFNDRPHLAVKFTKDVNTLAGGLAGLKAERGTALYDTIVFSLFYFNGVKGQRAILLLSDGKDEGSRFGWDDALDAARRAGVAIYAIGLGGDVDRRKLEKLAGETGGRAFFLQDPAELTAIYASIEEELRAKYLIAYQSTNTGGSNDFRTVELEVSRPGVEAKTLRGYYP